MSFSKIVKRELEVAFSKQAQPVWFRIVKYILLGLMFYFLWGTALLWIVFFTILVCGLALHFWFRYKTQGWTKSYGLWDYEKNKSRLQ